jgi:cytochrome c2
MNKIIVVIVTIIIALAACSSNQEGKELFELKCAECHLLEKSLKANKDLAQWGKTTRTMVKYSDGAITEKEAKKIAAYLANR